MGEGELVNFVLLTVESEGGIECVGDCYPSY